MDSKKIFRVGIVDDNKNLCNDLVEFLQEQKNTEVAFVAHDGLEAIAKLKSEAIDFLLLDIIMPHLDGFDVLEKMSTIKFLFQPKVMVMSSMYKDVVIQKAMSLGADYFVAKPLNLSMIHTRIEQLCNKKNDYVKSPGEKEGLEEKMYTRDVEMEITNLIHEIGVPAHIKGYRYLRDSISLAVKDMEILNAVTKELYPKVADLHGSTPTRVERAIRHAIEVAWERGKIEVIDKIFGYTIRSDRGKPTNSEFIAMIADKIRLERRVS